MGAERALCTSRSSRQMQQDGIGLLGLSGAAGERCADRDQPKSPPPRPPLLLCSWSAAAGGGSSKSARGTTISWARPSAPCRPPLPLQPVLLATAAGDHSASLSCITGGRMLTCATAVLRPKQSLERAPFMMTCVAASKRFVGDGASCGRSRACSWAAVGGGSGDASGEPTYDVMTDGAGEKSASSKYDVGRDDGRAGDATVDEGRAGDATIAMVLRTRALLKKLLLFTQTPLHSNARSENDKIERTRGGTGI